MRSLKRVVQDCTRQSRVRQPMTRGYRDRTKLTIFSRFLGFRSRSGLLSCRSAHGRRPRGGPRVLGTFGLKRIEPFLPPGRSRTLVDLALKVVLVAVSPARELRRARAGTRLRRVTVPVLAEQASHLAVLLPTPGRPNPAQRRTGTTVPRIAGGRVELFVLERVGLVLSPLTTDLRAARIDGRKILAVSPQASLGLALDLVVVNDIVPGRETVVFATSTGTEFTRCARRLRSTSVPFLAGESVSSAF